MAECSDVVWKHGHPEAINRLCALKALLGDGGTEVRVILADDLDEADDGGENCIHGVPFYEDCQACEAVEYPAEEARS